jgi:site-specific recombinase XerD
MSPQKKQAAIKQFTRMTNNYLRIIAKEVGITKDVTIYFARHSFATILRRSGASTEFISESLGHSNIKQQLHISVVLKIMKTQIKYLF